MWLTVLVINYRANRSLLAFVVLFFLIHSMIEIQDKTFSLFQRAVAARRLILFPAVEKVCKKTAAVNFLAGTISTPTERNKLVLKENLFRPQTVFLSIVSVLIVLSAKI